MKRLFFLSLFSVCAHAQDVQWHGYVSQGLTQSVGSDYITDDDDITTDLTEVGINGRWQIHDQLALVGQLNYLNGGNRYEAGARVDYLFIDWAVPHIANWSTHIHLGRYKNRHWLYSASRDVPHTRATAILPQSVYFDGARDIALGSDGISVQSTHSDRNGVWEVNWSYGKSPLDDHDTEAFLGPNALGKTEQDYVHQFSVFYQPPSYNWRLGASWLSSDFRYEAAPREFFFDGKSEIERVVLSGIYFSEFWELSAEWVQEARLDSGAYAPTFATDRTGEGGYVQARYLFNPKFSALLSYDTFNLDRNDPNGHKLSVMSQGLIPSYYGYENTYAIGARWNIAPNWRLQAEHHWVEGAARSTTRIIPMNAGGTDKHWRMWAVQLMYWF
ncbi:hypothetical protein [Salinimonas chungwhensis]|uniref:hypothetical protein n=1 Tax=Salinimonas chungwhensis TaxID=265425 RepID=UPI0003712B70|nr:hypothetical protein [Salinimonas chungwhensis]